MNTPAKRDAKGRRNGPFLDRLMNHPRTATDALLTAVAQRRLAPEEAVLQVLAPAAAEVGERWAGGAWDAATALVATGAIEDALAALGHTHAPREQPRGRLVFTAASGEPHTLPSRVVATALALRCWQVDVLRAPLPAEELTAYLTAAPPMALLVTCTTSAHLMGAGQTIAAAHEAGVPVIAGGAAFGSTARRAAMLGADGWASSVDGVERVLERCREPRPLARPSAARGASLADQYELLVAAWRATLAAQHAPEVAAWLSDWVPFVLRSLEAALTVDDEDVLADDLAWLARTTAARFDAPDAVAAMVTPMYRLLPVGELRAKTLLRNAADRLRADERDRGDQAAAAPARRSHRAARRGREDVYDGFAFVAATACATPIAVIGVVDDDRFVVKGAYGTDVGELYPPDNWYEDLFVSDGAVDERLTGTPGGAGTFYGRIALCDDNGDPFGALVVANPQGPPATTAQREALRWIARQVEARLATPDARPHIIDGEVPHTFPPDVHRKLDETVSGGGSRDDVLLRTSQVAQLFQVSPRTVNNWVAHGRLGAIATAGGHRRYRYRDVLALYREQTGGGQPDRDGKAGQS